MGNHIHQLPPEMDQVLIAMNPRAGAGASRRKVDAVVASLHDAGLSASVLTGLDEVTDRANALSEAGTLRAVVAAGGDGTVAEIANRLPLEIPIAVLPIGTENLLARYVGLTREPETVAQAVIDGCVANLDAGRANGRLFLLMASAGFDADVVGRLHAGRRGNISHFNYLKPILESIRSYDYPCLRIQATDPESGEMQSREICACWAFVFNLPCYGFGLPIAPWADGLDGRLDLCAFRRGSFWQGLNYLGQVIRGIHRQHADTVVSRPTKVRIESDRPVPYQLDGDPGGMLPVDIEILPNRLSLVAPRAWIDSHCVSLATNH